MVKKKITPFNTSVQKRDIKYLEWDFVSGDVGLYLIFLHGIYMIKCIFYYFEYEYRLESTSFKCPDSAQLNNVRYFSFVRPLRIDILVNLVTTLHV